MIIQICVGSSCHLKGAPEIIEMLNAAVEKHGISCEITLAGSFCIGECNRVGVTLQVDDEVCSGVTPQSFNEFFNDKILSKFNKG